MTTAFYVIAAITVSLVAVIIGKKVVNTRFTRGRVALELDEIIRDFSYCKNCNLAKEVLVVLGNSYRVAPGLLRIEDSFSELAKVDSWNLGHGQEQFEDWLQKRNIRFDANNVKTIGDLLREIEL